MPPTTDTQTNPPARRYRQPWCRAAELARMQRKVRRDIELAHDMARAALERRDKAGHRHWTKTAASLLIDQAAIVAAMGKPRDDAP